MLTERIQFESQDVILAGRLVLPDSGVAQAGVLCVTGGGLAGCESDYLEWQTFMAEEAGLGSLAFDARGIGDSEGSFRTDSEGHDPETSPANSQASRTIDTINAYQLLRETLAIKSNQSMGIIGGSMGGDIALHALGSIKPEALILRAPAAYPNEVHEVNYGPAWGPKIKELGGDTASLRSSNFERIKRLGLALMVIYTGGEAVVPKAIQERYRSAAAHVGGEVLLVGNREVPHTYIGDRLKPDKDTPESRQARLTTYKASTRFLQSMLNTRPS